MACETALAFLLVAAIALVRFSEGNSQFECSHGCPTAWHPVCSSAGDTYGNACLARCQHQDVQHDGQCSGDALNSAWTHVHQGSHKEALPSKHLKRFAKEQYRYVARIRLQRRLSKAEEGHPHHRQSSNQQQASGQGRGQLFSGFVRVTSEGHVYASPGLATAAPGDAAAQGTAGDALAGRPGQAPQTADGMRSRRSRALLAIFGTDDRVDCPRYPTYPFSAVGMVLGQGSGSEFLCSGTLVGPDVVLTAAHCVFSRTTGAFLDKLDFSPGRYHGSDSNDIYSPYASIPWMHVTLYALFVDANNQDPMPYDIAVIKLSSRIGDKAGWMGLMPPCPNASAVAGAETWQLTTAGYPIDKPQGSCVTTQCQVPSPTCDAAYLYHQCDTVEGQSGSAMWSMRINDQAGPTSHLRIAPYIRAVHNLEWTRLVTDSQGNQFYVYYTNSAVPLNPANYASVMAWIAPSFTLGDGPVQYTWYPLPDTMTVGASLDVSGGPAPATLDQSDGLSSNNTLANSSSTDRASATVASEVYFWNLTRLFRKAV